GANLLYVTESGRTTADTVTLTATAISSNALPAPLTYRATGGSFGGGFFLITGAGNDTVFIRGTAAGSAPLVYTGAGDDDVYVTGPAGTLDTLAGGLVLDAGPGANSLLVSAVGSAAADTVTLTASSVSGTAVPFALNYLASGGGTF